jgi:UDP-3-O-[3-hydroxymyristoyl] glucosamine N-acyltransferase
MTIHEIASIVNGEVVGNAKHTITKPSKIEEANSDSITFLANTKYLDYINTTEAGCIVISKELFSDKLKGNFIIVTMLMLHLQKYCLLFNVNVTTEISDKAYVHTSAKIG